ncbi:hypothetical protein IT397_02460 [Candidatus Nomurabacteria bacterium]|nr:hypothetical protein [Candidatus Nomurabacteria bacterium]
MLQIQSQRKIVSRLVKTTDGRTALVYFLVYLENGAVKAKMLSVKYSSEVNQDSKLAICGECKIPSIGTIVQKFYKSVVSPYSKFIFLTSQRSRAPNFI